MSAFNASILIQAPSFVSYIPKNNHFGNSYQICIRTVLKSRGIEFDGV